MTKYFNAVPERKYELVLGETGLQLVRAAKDKKAKDGPIVFVEDATIHVFYPNGYSFFKYDFQAREGDDGTLYRYAWIVLELGLVAIPVRFRVRFDGE